MLRDAARPWRCSHAQRLPLGERRAHDIVDHKWRRGIVEVAPFAFLAGRDTLRVVLADPLAPAVQDEPAIDPHFLPWERWIADKDEVNRVTSLGERSHKWSGTASQCGSCWLVPRAACWVDSRICLNVRSTLPTGSRFSGADPVGGRLSAICFEAV
jgi:hypothetical protein